MLSDELHLRLRVRKIIAQAAQNCRVKIINWILSADHVHIFAEILPHVSVSGFVKRAKGRSSRKIQQDLATVRKEY